MSAPLSVAFALLAASSLGAAAPTVSDDPCVAIAGQTYIPPADALACVKSFPFNETLRQNVLTNIARVFNFFTFEEYYLDSPSPFEESTVDIRAVLATINGTHYETDYDFNWDLFKFTTQLNDGHTRWFPSCYTSFQNILPAPIISIEVDGEQGVYVALDSVEFISLFGDEYTGYYDSIGFNWKRLAGARILSIEGQAPYDYVDKIASTVSGNYLDHGIRVNSVFTSYRISSAAFSQRLGDLAGPTGVEKTSLTFELVVVGSDTPETVEVPYLASYAGDPFTDGPSFWAANCAAQETTNGIDYKDQFSAQSGDKGPRRMRADIIDAFPSNGVGLPGMFVPTLPPVGGSGDVIKSYILPSNETGVMYVGSFSPADYDAFQTDVASAIADFKAAGVTKLLIDLTNNGGGYVCLGQYLFQYLSGSDFGYPGFESTTRGNELAQKIVASDIELGLDSYYAFYAPDNWAFLNDTIQPATYNYLDPVLPFTVNGVQDPTSQRFHDTCEISFTQDVPAEPPFALEDIAIVSNGNCASTCAMFSTLMYEHHDTKVAIFGGKPGEEMEYKGMSGNQVLEWYDLDSEIKTADLKNDPLAPPDLLVNGNMRVNWRTAWSILDEDTPIAYRSERSQFRFPYTNETYNNPQNLWIFAESELLA